MNLKPETYLKSLYVRVCSKFSHFMPILSLTALNKALSGVITNLTVTDVLG